MEKGKRVIKVRGKEIEVEKVVRGISKEKERGRETGLKKREKVTIKGKVKVKEKETTGECLHLEKVARGFVMTVERKDRKLEKACAKSRQ